LFLSKANFEFRCALILCDFFSFCFCILVDVLQLCVESRR
jgi:hypothetical protein